MFQDPLTKSHRDELVVRFRRLVADNTKAMIAMQRDRAADLLRQADQAREEYLQRLPVVTMATCPFTAAPLMRSFDPFGLDGPWWQAGTARPAPPPPHTFCLLRGSVNLNGKKPIAGPQEVLLGPEVPYVIPRMLGLPGMVAVIGELAMSPGYTAYPIAYFSEQRPPARDLTCEWLQSTYSYRTLFGEAASVIAVDPWDFDLKAWILKGKVRWCVPGSGNEALAPPGKPQDCPYLDLKGRREYLSIRGDTIRPLPLPDGVPIGPADLLD